MPPAAIPISDLARRLARKESEVQRLRRAYETRLAELKNRREELAEKLRRLEAEIQSVTQESPEPSGAAVAAEESVPRRTRGKRGKLPALLVKLLQEGGHALTVKQLADEVRRRKFPTTSKNILRLVQTRVYEMVKKGILAHASGQPGFIVKHSSNGKQTSLQEEGTGEEKSRSETKGRKGCRARRWPGRPAAAPRSSYQDFGTGEGAHRRRRPSHKGLGDWLPEQEQEVRRRGPGRPREHEEHRTRSRQGLPIEKAVGASHSHSSGPMAGVMPREYDHASPLVQKRTGTGWAPLQANCSAVPGLAHLLERVARSRQ